MVEGEAGDRLNARPEAWLEIEGGADLAAILGKFVSGKGQVGGEAALLGGEAERFERLFTAALAFGEAAGGVDRESAV